MTTSPLPDPLDEHDHRDRIDMTNDLLIRRECGYWHWAWTGGGARCPLVTERHATGGTKYTLADWTGIAGPLRFVDEVTA